MSAIPAVLSALTAIAGAALPGWQTINGTEASVTTLGPLVVVVGGDEVTGRRDLDSMSLDTTSETFVVPVTVSASLPGADQNAADTQALDAYDVLERAVREHVAGPDLGVGGVLQAIPTGDFSLRRLSDDNGRHAVVRFSVLVTAQNT